MQAEAAKTGFSVCRVKLRISPLLAQAIDDVEDDWWAAVSYFTRHPSQVTPEIFRRILDRVERLGVDVLKLVCGMCRWSPHVITDLDTTAIGRLVGGVNDCLEHGFYAAACDAIWELTRVGMGIPLDGLSAWVDPLFAAVEQEPVDEVHLRAVANVARALISLGDERGITLFGLILARSPSVAPFILWREVIRTMKAVPPDQFATFWDLLGQPLRQELQQPTCQPDAVQTLAVFAEQPELCDGVASLAAMWVGSGRLGPVAILWAATQEPDFLEAENLALAEAAPTVSCEMRIAICEILCEERVRNPATNVPWAEVGETLESADTTAGQRRWMLSAVCSALQDPHDWAELDALSDMISALADDLRPRLEAEDSVALESLVSAEEMVLAWYHVQ